jgi:hypothetical protein
VEDPVMARRLERIVVLVSVLLTARVAGAFTMGEVATTTGMQGTLATSGGSSAKGTIGVVKGSLGQSVATKQGQLANAEGAVAWGGGPGTSGWATAGAGNGGWQAAAGGWTSGGSAGSGWAVGGPGNSGWVSGAWGNGAVP